MRITDQVQSLLTRSDLRGAIAIDATAGNGHDSLGLAKAVGSEGYVFAIDIQVAAIAATRQRLETAGLLDHCELLLGDHANKLSALLQTHRGKIRIITFNLGYLPGSDKTVQTTEASTLPALNAAAELLENKGRLLVTVYRGHPGATTEAKAVGDWFAQLAKDQWLIDFFEPQGETKTLPPILYTALKVATQ